MNKETSAPRPPVSARVLSWLLYDFGMSWFSMVVLTAYFILYFKEVVVAQKSYGDFLWGVAISSAMVVSVLLSPILGAIADAGGRKKSLLVSFAAISILSILVSISQDRANKGGRYSW